MLKQSFFKLKKENLKKSNAGVITLFITFFMLATSSNAMASEDLIIYTFGYAETLESIIFAIKDFMGSNVFVFFLRIALVISILIIGFNAFTSGGSSISFFLKLAAVGVFSLFLTTSVSKVNIVDVEDSNSRNQLLIVKKIDTVPVFVAYPMYLISNIEYHVRKQFSESLFHTLAKKNVHIANPNDLLNLSLVNSLNFLKDSVNFRIHDDKYIKTFESFFENCILPDAYSGYINLDDLTSSETFWKDLKNASHKARFGYNYLDLTKNYKSNVQTCDVLYSSLDKRLEDLKLIHSSSFAQISKSFGAISSEIAAQKLGVISKIFLNYSDTSAKFLQSNMSMNLFNDTYTKIAASSGLSTTGLSYGIAKSNTTLINNAVMQSINAKKYLIIAKSYLSIIFVAIIPIIALIGIATGNMRKPTAMIIGLLLALGLWGILEQLFDYLIINRSLNLFSSVHGSLSLANQSFINQNILDSMSIGLGFYFLIPTLAFALATMSGYAANSIMGGITSVATTGIGSAAEETATGNASIGNVRGYNYSTNKVDAASTKITGVHNQDSVSNKVTSVATRSNDSIISNIQENTVRNKETVENSKVFSGDNLQINGKKARGVISFNGSVASFNGTMEGSDGKVSRTINNALVGFGSDGEIKVQGDEIQGKNESGISSIEDNSTTKNNSKNLVTGENYVGLRQEAMKESAAFTSLMQGVVDMQEKVNQGKVTSAEYLSHVRNLSAAIASESIAFGEISKGENSGLSTTVGAKADINFGMDSGSSILGFIAKSITGGSIGGSIGAYGNIQKNYSEQDSVRHNVLTNDIANIMLSENNANTMTAKISDKLNSFSGTYNTKDVYPNGVIDNENMQDIKLEDVNLDNVKSYLNKFHQ